MQITITFTESAPTDIPVTRCSFPVIDQLLTEVQSYPASSGARTVFVNVLHNLNGQPATVTDAENLSILTGDEAFVLGRWLDSLNNLAGADSRQQLAQSMLATLG